MKLAEYLAANGLTEAEFASQIGCVQQSVNRYKLERRIPPPATMSKIHRATHGKVAPADFYELDDLTEDPCTNKDNGKAA